MLVLRLFMKLLKLALGIILFVVLCATLFINLAPSFGDSPSGESLARINASPNWGGDGFVNLVPTKVSTTDAAANTSLKDFFIPPADKNPTQPLPSIQFDASKFDNGDFVWFGHSTVLFKTDDVTVLADPVFNNASPVPWTVEPFAMQFVNAIDDLPAIDVVIISHDHYDHLDYQAIKELDKKVSRFFVPLGIKAHLLSWGIASEKISEMDWYESENYKSVDLTLTPSRHFSGRGVMNRMSTLWGSWVIKSPNLNVFFSGDSGYFDEFKKIGEKYGPFDIAFMEDGAYNVSWKEIHMMPEESVQASVDLNAKLFFPIHWGKFDLAMHVWTDPIERAKKAAKENNVKVATPVAGEIFTVTDYPTREWWKDVD